MKKLLFVILTLTAQFAIGQRGVYHGGRGANHGGYYSYNQAGTYHSGTVTSRQFRGQRGARFYDGNRGRRGRNWNQTRIVRVNGGPGFFWNVTQCRVWNPGFYTVQACGTQVWNPGFYTWRETRRVRVYNNSCGPRGRRW